MTRWQKALLIVNVIVVVTSIGITLQSRKLVALNNDLIEIIQHLRANCGSEEI